MNGNFKKQNEEYYKPHFYFSNKANKEDEKGQIRNKINEFTYKLNKTSY